MLRVARPGLAVIASVLFGWSAARAEEGPATSDAALESRPTIAEGAGEVSEARELFRQGVALAVTGKWQEALSAFERSGRLRPHAVTTYNVAFCERKLGRYARAARLFASALEEERGTGASHLPVELERDAVKWLKEIDALLATASVTVWSADTFVLVDGRPLARSRSVESRPIALGGALDPGAPERVPGIDFDVKVDPGTHVFRFFETGRSEKEVVKTVGVGERVRVVPMTMSPTLRTPEPNAAERPGPELSHSGHTEAYVALGIGGAGLAVGATFGILALMTHSSLASACSGSTCPPNRSNEVERLGTYSDVATSGFVVGIGALAVGTILLATAPSGHLARPRRSTGLQIAPAGMSGTF